MRVSGLITAGLAAGWCAVATGAAAQKPAAPAPPAVSAEAAEFFEKQVRPVLVESCYSCHGPKIQQAGLRMDNFAALLKGTDTGKVALVPGQPDKSPFIQVLSHTGPIKMPPQGKLPAKSIEALTAWVKMGAPWPATGGTGVVVSPADGAKKHWAFQPVRKTTPPAVKNKAWVKSPIDAFVLAKLEQKGITPAPSADRRTLIRRAYVDLTGLPPTAAEVEAFVNDKSPTAYATVVDRLLASPRYGERWGRYWLDVARYADTKGYVFQEERRYPYGYTYRDYVIRAFNEDVPYDRFLQEQIAADHLDLGKDRSALAAMGFLTVGRRFLNNQADINDDRIDVLFRGTQGLTVSCARCHDHKFDPIPTADYYSVYGVFASSTEPKDLPLLAAAERTAEYVAYEKQLGVLEGEVQSFLRKKHTALLTLGKAKIAESLLAAREASRPGADMGAIAQKRELPAQLIRRWMTFLADTAKGHHAVFSPWNQFAAIPDAEFAAQAGPLAARLAANGDSQRLLNPTVAAAFAGPAPTSLDDVAGRLARVLSAPTNDQQIEHALDSIGCPLNIAVNEVEGFFNRADRNEFNAVKEKVDKFKATSPAAPPRAMVMVDTPQPVTPRIFRRGNANNPGDVVPRQFLAVLSPPDRKPFQKGSGRLELAQAITSKDNPLTARVMANRIWQWHFGQGLVATPSDFGLRSDPPSHPELLDFLATQFMENGWSIKKLHRLMMLSSTYQQSSTENPKYVRLDPQNTLLWHANRRRLDWEALRDTLLWTSGKLNLEVGGAAVDLLKEPFVTRRTVYGFIDRQNLPNLFRTFDLASPDTHSPGRFVTTVPQQALFMLNSPFVLEQAKALNARPEVAGAAQPAEKIRQLHRIAFARDPEPDEVTLGLRFLKSVEAEGSAQTSPLWQYGYGEVDAATGRVRGYKPLSHFTGTSWQGGVKVPDDKTGWCMLTSQGGHAGNDQAHAVIRRWTAPQDGVISIVGTLSHSRDQGDGVRARIVSSRKGLLGSWEAFKSNADTGVANVEVKAGDTLDFVVDCKTNSNSDSFAWAPLLRMSGAGSGEWNSASAFGGPAGKSKGLDAWEKYAQVLLMSNELAFVD